MPAKIKVRIVAARDLPVMDRSSDLADAFAEADDEELQDEPLQIRIMDHDTVTAHDAIGKVLY